MIFLFKRYDFYTEIAFHKTGLVTTEISKRVFVSTVGGADPRNCEQC